MAQVGHDQEPASVACTKLNHEISFVLVSVSETKKPDWDRLYALAEAQVGQFTTAQAAAAGYSSQLLNKYLKSGRVVRSTRGV